MTEMIDPDMDPRQMEPKEQEIDRLLRRSMAAPVPSLPRDFDQRVVREARRSSQPLGQYHRVLLTGYGLVSVMVSALVMRGQGLDWSVISATILAPLALVAIARAAWRTRHRTSTP